MKIINPVGSSNSELNAYGCVCSVVVGNYSAVSGNVPCNVCAYSCNPNDSGNSSANQSASQWRVTHT